MDFFLKFTLISYAAITFFSIGLYLALFYRIDLNLFKLFLIFISVAVPLSISFVREPLQDRLLISLVWTSVIGLGFRFGRKMKQNSVKD